MTLTLGSHKSSCTHLFDYICWLSPHRIHQFLASLQFKRFPIHKAALPRAKFLCHISHALQSLLTDFYGIITVNLYSRTDTDKKLINNNYNFGINDCRACNLWQRKFGHVLEAKAKGTKFDLAVKYVNVNPVSSFGQIWYYMSTKCYISGFKVISLLVPKKILKSFYHIWAWWPSVHVT